MRSSKHGTPQERVARVLEAGAVCFGQKGFFEATFEDVMHESGLSRGSLYWHFSSKEALFDAVLEHCAAQLEAALDAGVEALVAEDQVIARFLHGIARDVEVREEAYRVLYLAPRPTAAVAQLTDLTLLFVAHVEIVVEAARRRGEIGFDGAIVDVVHALAEGMIIRRLCDTSFDVSSYIATSAQLLAPTG